MGDEYNGVHVRFRAELAGAQFKLQVDIGFGDAVFPGAGAGDVPCTPANVSADHSSLSTGSVDCGKVARDGSTRHPQQPHEGPLRHLAYGEHMDIQVGILA
jgi:hypothetical protein